MIPLVFLVMLIAQPIYELDEIVVTATRYPVALQDIALATVVIDKEELDKLNAISVGEVLQAYAGADIKDYGNPGSVSSLSIRGIPANGTLVLVNGHPLNLITVGMADLSAVNINTVERIEIVKGPVSSLYGANALGGVVNIITTKNYEKPEVHFEITPSTTNTDELLQTKEIFVDGGIPFGHAYGGVAGGYASSDGYRHNSDLTRYSLQGKLGYEYGKLEINSSVIYDEKKYGLPGPKPLVDSLDSVPQFGDSTVTSLFDRQEDKIILGDMMINWYMADNLTWYNTLFANRKYMNYHTTYASWLGDTITEDFDYLTHTLGMNTMAVLDINDTKVVFGIDGHYDTLKTTKNSEQTGDTVWHASSYNIGTWFECKKKFNNIILVPSIRFDKNSEFGNFFSPQFGIVASFIPNFLIKFSVGKAFRAPTFNDLYWPIYGNLDLKPEHGWAYELRLESSPSPALFTAISLFARSVKDRISWLPVDNGMWQPQNVNYISVKGLDFEVNNQINEIVGIHVEGSYLYSRQKNDEVVYDFYDWIADTGLTIIEEVEREATFTPKYSASAKFDFKLPHEFGFNIAGLSVTEQVNYYAHYHEDGSVSMDTKLLDSYLILNIGISKAMFKFLKLSIGAKNVLDTKYATQFGSLDDLDYPMPGRTYFARLAVNY